MGTHNLLCMNPPAFFYLPKKGSMDDEDYRKREDLWIFLSSNFSSGFVMNLRDSRFFPLLRTGDYFDIRK